MSEEKLLGNERRNQILLWLKQADHPITGSELAKRTNVSRQVIVQDISLLKAKNEPIIATSQGYIMTKNDGHEKTTFERIIISQHPPEKSHEELNLIVDHGVTVKDVKIEHPVYGDLTASIMVSNRKEVEEFIHRIVSKNAAYLSELTEGLHLHTISADSEEKLDNVCFALKEAGYIVSEEEE